MPGCDSKPSMEINRGLYLLVATTIGIVYTGVDIEAISSLGFKNPKDHERRQCNGQHSQRLRTFRNDAGPTRRRLGLRRSDRQEACLVPALPHGRSAHLDSASCGPHIGCQNERSCEMRKARVTCASLKLVPFVTSTECTKPQVTIAAGVIKMMTRGRWRRDGLLSQSRLLRCGPPGAVVGRC
jgi:hypothetical protein